MALAAARPTAARGVATVAAPWHFSGFPDEAKAMLAGLWRASAPLVDRLGVLPMEVLQSAFWSLDPARTVAKFEAFADMADGSPAAEMFVQLEDWANDGPPLSAAAARELFEGFFARDAPGLGRWGGDPADLRCPLLHVVSTRDRIVPAASAPHGGQRIDPRPGPCRHDDRRPGDGHAVGAPLRLAFPALQQAARARPNFLEDREPSL
jgi:polyhydroxyalkanoate synthase